MGFVVCRETISGCLAIIAIDIVIACALAIFLQLVIR